jgi:hypothetical protein
MAASIWLSLVCFPVATATVEGVIVKAVATEVNATAARAAIPNCLSEVFMG